MLDMRVFSGEEALYVADAGEKEAVFDLNCTPSTPMEQI
jgi:hypothetical protein